MRVSTDHHRPSTDDALRLERVSKVYGDASSPVRALDEVSLSLPPGTFTSVMGPSGSGKSTLLQCAAGLDRPTGGQVFVAGVALPHGDEAALTTFRRGRTGFVFQQYNLIPYLTVEQNIVLPQRLAGHRPDRTAVAGVMARLGIAELAQRRPAELSGGQQQRVAIARAVAGRPAVLFADEPTGALDTVSGREVLGLVRELVQDVGHTVVMVTHDPFAASYAGRVLFLVDGVIVDQVERPTAAGVAERMTQLDELVAQRPARSVGAR